MRIIDILTARESIAKLNKMKFNDFKMVTKVYKLTKKLNDTMDIYQQEQQKIVDMYVKKDANGKPDILNNMYQFENDENKRKFIVENEKLRFSEVDDVEKIDISISSIDAANDFTSEEMLKLEPIINWVD